MWWEVITKWVPCARKRDSSQLLRQRELLYPLPQTKRGWECPRRPGLQHNWTLWAINPDHTARTATMHNPSPARVVLFLQPGMGMVPLQWRTPHSAYRHPEMNSEGKASTWWRCLIPPQRRSWHSPWDSETEKSPAEMSSSPFFCSCFYMLPVFF